MTKQLVPPLTNVWRKIALNPALSTAAAVSTGARAVHVFAEGWLGYM